MTFIRFSAISSIVDCLKAGATVDETAAACATDRETVMDVGLFYRMKYNPDTDAFRCEAGDHAWRFMGDDPYIECAFCGEVRDAITGRVVRAALDGESS